MVLSPCIYSFTPKRAAKASIHDLLDAIQILLPLLPLYGLNFVNYAYTIRSTPSSNLTFYVYSTFY